ncbi:hypothetical protein [Micromonospora sp. NBS 11-29]|uniref:hypothetical protein n=1 Tax=Micromonospora sp. NBS 11-29 TaxID=1960879 RepID=UPI0020CFB894|nr:hypothetical protein [Micromonospora sp. NBS 11-29]
MNDPHRTAGSTPDRRLRPLLWLVLFGSAAANVVLSNVLGNLWAGAAFGLLALLCGVALTVDHYRNR